MTIDHNLIEQHEPQKNNQQFINDSRFAKCESSRVKTTAGRVYKINSYRSPLGEVRLTRHLV